MGRFLETLLNIFPTNIQIGNFFINSGHYASMLFNFFQSTIFDILTGGETYPFFLCLVTHFTPGGWGEMGHLNFFFKWNNHSILKIKIKWF